ncbi:MAG: bifunctional phosphopantothenoylcysteine decarboxylase/phosphopantothenate--cysteine ligase CoaBC [Firmicutes bacterium]|nr:bifunctional phosphopantothenoylcysteine decarboxylase/phosphopantothenate--cysteine ligase CoaBC [Candidatus Fermentithermobacillaceae bacterium]
MLRGKTIVVGVTGGIAAYKAVEVVSRLVKLGATVRVMMTKNATKFVTPMTFRTISGNPVVVEMFEEPRVWNVEHVSMAEAADVMVLVPCTANVIGKIAAGIADDFVTTTVMACTAPKLLCPAMNHNMYENPVVQGNIEKLRSLGYHVLEPEYGRLASGAVGKGRLPDPDKIVDEIVKLACPKRDLEGVSFLITAGPTREWFDPVRFISNPSSGKMGYALARACLERGASVYLVSGPVALTPPPGAVLRKVETTRQMLDACLELFPDVRVVIGAAAPCDFAPSVYHDQKIKKTGAETTVTLVPTPDIMKTLGQQKGDRILVGFAAETEDLESNAIKKLAEKNLDIICANPVHRPDSGFGSDTDILTLFYPDGHKEDLGLVLKEEAAHIILDRIKSLLEADVRH